jgi:DNA-binding CsgD family transcriptional regulator
MIFYGVLGDVDAESMRFVPLEWHELLLTSPIAMVDEAMTMSIEVSETMALLTGRQQQIAHALSQGFTQVEIAEALSISRRTVANELVSIRAAFRDIRETMHPGVS